MPVQVVSQGPGIRGRDVGGKPCPTEGRPSVAGPPSRKKGKDRIKARLPFRGLNLITNHLKQCGKFMKKGEGGGGRSADRQPIWLLYSTRSRGEGPRREREESRCQCLVSTVRPFEVSAGRGRRGMIRKKEGREGPRISSSALDEWGKKGKE